MQMTVKELYNALDLLIKQGHENTRVIANCRFTINNELYDHYMTYLNDIYYQSGDIELAFSDSNDD